MAAKYIIFFALIAGTAYAQSDPLSIQDLENVSLPPELQGKLDSKEVEQLQNTSLSEIVQRCEINGGPEAFNKSKTAAVDLQTCVSNLINKDELQMEIEKAKPNGEVDEVFKKYCAKKPLLESCVKNFTETSKVCLSVDEQKHLKTVYNVSEQLVEFICFKEGDRIALFIAEGGQECFQDKQDGLKTCFEELNLSKNSTLSFDEKQCKQLSALQVCVVQVLEGCPKPTSANIVESLFNFIRKATPCKNFAASKKASAASGVSVTAATLIMAVATVLLI